MSWESSKRKYHIRLGLIRKIPLKVSKRLNLTKIEWAFKALFTLKAKMKCKESTFIRILKHKRKI